MTTETDTTEDAAPQEPTPVAAAVAPAITTSGPRTLRIFADLAIARAQVIRRAPLSEPVLPEAVQRGIDELWGEPTTPAMHVAKILDAVARIINARVADGR
mgnify:CR=1 FL=1